MLFIIFPLFNEMIVSRYNMLFQLMNLEITWPPTLRFGVVMTGGEKTMQTSWLKLYLNEEKENARLSILDQQLAQSITDKKNLIPFSLAQDLLYLNLSHQEKTQILNLCAYNDKEVFEKFLIQHSCITCKSTQTAWAFRTS